jgi:hypothetical protein
MRYFISLDKSYFLKCFWVLKKDILLVFTFSLEKKSVYSSLEELLYNERNIFEIVVPINDKVLTLEEVNTIVKNNYPELLL